MPGKKIIKKVVKKAKTTKGGRPYGPNYDKLDDIIDKKYSTHNPNVKNFNRDVSKLDESYLRTKNPYYKYLDDPSKIKSDDFPKEFWEIKGRKKGGMVKYQYGGSQVVNHKGMKVPGMYKDGGAKKY